MNRTLTTENESRRCYVILESEQGEHGYIPSLVIEDEPGYSPMTGGDDQEPWYWGKTRERAKAICARYNRQHFGISQSTADRIVASSMKAQNIPESDAGSDYVPGSGEYNDMMFGESPDH